MTEKLCRKCGTIKPAQQFHKRNSRPIGMHPWCKDCMRAYRRAHSASSLAAVTRYRTKNAEKHREYNAQLKVTKRTHYTALQNARRTRAEGNGGNYTAAEWEALKLLYGFGCLRCGRCEPEIKLTADHVLPVSCGGSGDISNIQPLCLACNSAKHIATTDYRRLPNVPRS